jgi:hypothetical protein
MQMAKQAKKTNEKKIKTDSAYDITDTTVEVLYQRLGDKWFAFSMMDDEVVFGSISADELSPEALRGKTKAA